MKNDAATIDRLLTAAKAQEERAQKNYAETDRLGWLEERHRWREVQRWLGEQR